MYLHLSTKWLELWLELWFSLMVCFMVHRQTIKTQTQMSMTHLEKKSKFSKLWFACTAVLFFAKSFQMEGHLHESPVNNSFPSQHYNCGRFNSGYLYIISPDTMLLFSRDLCLWCCPFEFGYELLFYVSYWVCHSAGWPYIAWKSHEMIYALGLPKRYIVWSSVISFPSSLKHSWFLKIEVNWL